MCEHNTIFFGLTIADLLGPFQQLCPPEYFIWLYLLGSPVHSPQVLKEICLQKFFNDGNRTKEPKNLSHDSWIKCSELLPLIFFLLFVFKSWEAASNTQQSFLKPLLGVRITDEKLFLQFDATWKAIRYSFNKAQSRRRGYCSIIRSLGLSTLPVY